MIIAIIILFQRKTFNQVCVLQSKYILCLGNEKLKTLNQKCTPKRTLSLGPLQGLKIRGFYKINRMKKLQHGIESFVEINWVKDCDCQNKFRIQGIHLINLGGNMIIFVLL